MPPIMLPFKSTSDDSPAAEPDRIPGQLLQALLNERDLPCPLCGYNLRNLTSEICPECGRALKLQIGLSEPQLGAYITLLVACCLGFGGSALFSLVAMAAAPHSWWARPAASILLAQLLITGALLPFVIARRARFRKTSASWQRTSALLVCLMVAILSGAFVLLFKER